MIYTKTGDKGTTSLASGERVRKTDLRIETYGTADELNSFFGWLRALLAEVEGAAEHEQQIAVVQSKLFDLGALLSEAPGEWIREADVTEIEHWIDALQAELPAQHAFILPAGSETIAAAHICRTVTRRLERLMVRLAEQEGQTEELAVALRWVNRLSDYCFVLARKSTILQKKTPIEWKK